MTGIDENTYDANERTPLLEARGSKNTKTPLDKLQIGIVLLGTICEPFSSQAIYPFINELVSTLDVVGGDETKVGYYAGMIESLFYLTEALTVYQWSRMSDKIGRKPVILFGMMGTIISMTAFGLSKTLRTLVISRCLCGLLNGNIGVMKSTMGDLTDTTNRADVFALMPAVWALGTTMGPLLGGVLTRPSDRFPALFTARFWKDYPYFLPCAVPALVVLIIFTLTAVWFKESVPSKRAEQQQRVPQDENGSDQAGKAEEEAPLPFSQLLTFPVVISIANYMTLAFLNMAVNALLPLFFHMPIELGGLGLDPAVIGYAMGIYGLGTGMFQVLFFAKIVRRFGYRKTFIMAMSTLIPAFLTFPLVSLLAKQFGVFWGVWLLVGLIICLLFFMDTAYGCVLVYVTESAPNRRSLGATNGLSQTTASTVRAIGPVLATSLYSFSVRNNIVGGYGVYFILTGLSFLALIPALQPPVRSWGVKH